MATKPVWNAKNTDLLRNHYGQLCTVLASAKETQISFAVRLFEKHIIDMQTKNAVLHTKGLKGANMLVDRVMMKIDLHPKRLDIVLNIMEELEDLRDILEKMKQGQRATEDKCMDEHFPGMCIYIKGTNCAVIILDLLFL